MSRVILLSLLFIGIVHISTVNGLEPIKKDLALGEIRADKLLFREVRSESQKRKNNKGVKNKSKKSSKTGKKRRNKRKFKSQTKIKKTKGSKSKTKRKKQNRKKSKTKKGSKQKQTKTNLKKTKKKKKFASGNTKKKQSNTQSRQETCGVNTVSDSCMMKALSVMQYEKNQIQTFLKQHNALTNFNSIAGSKYKKRDNFWVTAAYLLQALGGNLSSPTCGQQTSITNSSQKQAKTVAETYVTMANCSDSIKEACTISEETYNDEMSNTLVGCKSSMIGLKKAFEDCRIADSNQANGTAACECWDNAHNLKDGIKALKCSAKDVRLNLKKAKDRCRDAFMACKKTEDTASAMVSACSEGSVKSQSEAES